MKLGELPATVYRELVVTPVFDYGTHIIAQKLTSKTEPAASRS